LGRINIMPEKKWSVSDLRMSCRLLPGRDDDIIDYFAKVGPKEKSYELRRAMRLYVQAQTGKAPVVIPTTPVVHYVQRANYVSINTSVDDVVVPKPEAIGEAPEMSEEQAKAALGNLMDNFK
jgi:hypothetical protein